MDVSKLYRDLLYEESLTLLVTIHLREFVLLSNVKCVCIMRDMFRPVVFRMGSRMKM